MAAQVIIDILGNTKGIQNSLNDTNKMLDKFGGQFKGLSSKVTAFAGIAAGAGGFGKVITAASDLNEALSINTKVFGNAADDIQEFAEGAAENLGISETAALNLSTQIGTLLGAFGFAESETAAWSEKLLTLGADLGSAFNQDPQIAVNALGAALRGESEPARRFGIIIDDARLKAKAFEMGLYDGVGALEANARAQAALALIMEQTQTVQGDFSDTADSFANQIRTLRARLDDLAAGFGGGLLAPVNLAVGAFDNVIKIVDGIPESFKNAIAQFVGFGAAGLLASKGVNNLKGKLDELAAQGTKTASVTQGATVQMANAFTRSGFVDNVKIAQRNLEGLQKAVVDANGNFAKMGMNHLEFNDRMIQYSNQLRIAEAELKKFDEQSKTATTSVANMGTAVQTTTGSASKLKTAFKNATAGMSTMIAQAAIFGVAFWGVSQILNRNAAESQAADEALERLQEEALRTGHSSTVLVDDLQELADAIGEVRVESEGAAEDGQIMTESFLLGQAAAEGIGGSFSEMADDIGFTPEQLARIVEQGGDGFRLAGEASGNSWNAGWKNIINADGVTASVAPVLEAIREQVRLDPDSWRDWAAFASVLDAGAQSSDGLKESNEEAAKTLFESGDAARVAAHANEMLGGSYIDVEKAVKDAEGETWAFTGASENLEEQLASQGLTIEDVAEDLGITTEELKGTAGASDLAAGGLTGVGDAAKHVLAEIDKTNPSLSEINGNLDDAYVAAESFVNGWYGLRPVPVMIDDVAKKQAELAKATKGDAVEVEKDALTTATAIVATAQQAVETGAMTAAQAATFVDEEFEKIENSINNRLPDDAEAQAIIDRLNTIESETDLSLQYGIDYEQLDEQGDTVFEYMYKKFGAGEMFVPINYTTGTLPYTGGGSGSATTTQRFEGGPAQRNKPYLVGEFGPELFMPNASGQIVNNNRTLDALGNAGGTTVHVNVQSQADPSRIGREVAASLRMSGAI